MISDTLVFSGFPKVHQYKYFLGNRPSDADGSYLLMNYGLYRLVKRINEDNAEKYQHTLFKKTDNKIVEISSIGWQQRAPENRYEISPSRKTMGVVGKQEIFLEVDGKIAVLPIENIPPKYQIPLSVCGEQRFCLASCKLLRIHGLSDL